MRFLQTAPAKKAMSVKDFVGGPKLAGNNSFRFVSTIASFSNLCCPRKAPSSMYSMGAR